jgi:rubredoxin
MAPAMATLRTCPDCGGLLDPTRPTWTATIDLVSARLPEEPGTVEWQCLICGYEEKGPGPDRPHDEREGMPAVR